jgi:hypothetical protein
VLESAALKATVINVSNRTLPMVTALLILPPLSDQF